MSTRDGVHVNKASEANGSSCTHSLLPTGYHMTTVKKWCKYNCNNLQGLQMHSWSRHDVPHVLRHYHHTYNFQALYCGKR